MAWEKEAETIKNTASPITKKQIVTDLQTIGLQKGDIVIVHSSQSKMGWIVGGANAIIEALMDLLTPEGTLVMVAHSSGNSDPTKWQYPPVPKEWIPIIKAEMLPFNPATTPTRGIGTIPEVFRTYPGVRRSAHPQVSVVVWGKNASQIVQLHPYGQAFGDQTPYEKLYLLNGKVLLLGVDHINNTMLHHAEWKANIPNHPSQVQGAAVMDKGKRIWASWEEIVDDDEDFLAVGHAYEKSIDYKPSKVGNAIAKLLSLRDLIDFAVPWFREHRKYPTSSPPPSA